MRYLILFLLCSISLLAKETTTYYQDVTKPDKTYNITIYDDGRISFNGPSFQLMGEEIGSIKNGKSYQWTVETPWLMTILHGDYKANKYTYDTVVYLCFNNSYTLICLKEIETPWWARE